MKYKMLEFIPSKAMHEHLKEKLECGEFSPSYEDMAATVFNGDGDIFQKAEYYKLLLNEPVDDNTRMELEWHVKMAENIHIYIENKNNRYSFVCRSIAEKNYPVFNSFKKAVKYMHRNDLCYAAIADKHIKTSEKFIAEIIVSDNKIIEANNYHKDWWTYPEDSLARRYVKYPIPFKQGDVVYNAHDSKRKLFCVVNASQPEYSEALDSIDACITVIPYEFKEYATPEKIEAHYKALEERRKNGACFYDDSMELDVISIEHEHMNVLYAELVKND